MGQGYEARFKLLTVLLFKNIYGAVRRVVLRIWGSVF